MKAYEVQQFGVENLALVEREKPQPGPGEAVARVLAQYSAAGRCVRPLVPPGGSI